MGSQIAEKQVLIICRLPDPHVAAVCSALVDRCISHETWDLNNPDSFSFTLKVGSSRELASKSPTAIWWRYKETALTYHGTSTSTDSFVRREWLAALRSLSLLTPSAVWINHPVSSAAASHKISNLVVAAEIGFDIPQTLVSNSSLLCSDFFERHKSSGVIYKPLTYYYEAPDIAVFTSEVDPASLQSLDSISIAPVLLQEKIAKAFELRVTVVGERMFCVKIDSQRRHDTLLDWRRNQFDASIFSEWEPPADFISKLIRLQKRLGLLYGAYDFIVERDSGRTIFLEVNPGGQWMWLELATRVNISGAIADLLSLPKSPWPSASATQEP